MPILTEITLSWSVLIDTQFIRPCEVSIKTHFSINSEYLVTFDSCVFKEIAIILAFRLFTMDGNDDVLAKFAILKNAESAS